MCRDGNVFINNSLLSEIFIQCRACSTALRVSTGEQALDDGGPSGPCLGCIGEAHAEVAGQLLPDGEAEAVRGHPVGALVQRKGRHEAWGRDHACDAELLGLPTEQAPQSRA